QGPLRRPPGRGRGAAGAAGGSGGLKERSAGGVRGTPEGCPGESRARGASPPGIGGQPMIPFTLKEIAEAAGGRLVDADPDAVVGGVQVDSRQIKPGELFVALPGSRTDGSLFAAAAAQAGGAATPAPGGTVLARPRVDGAEPLRGP